MNGVSVFGLGKLGLCLAACLASKGYRVIGVDVDTEKTSMVNAGITPIAETGLSELLKLQVSEGRLTATQDHAHAVDNSEVSFILVPTPSEASGSFSTTFVEQAARNIGLRLRAKDIFHVVVVVSTVLPGSMRSAVQPVLEEVSGKRCGMDFGLCYSPFLVALGSVIRDICQPDILMIGQSDERSGTILAGIHRNLCQNCPPAVPTTFENVELAKIGINSFVTMKISFANTLANVCQRLPYANVDIVTRIIGMDSRIGTKYLKGGLGFGGPCFPRDNLAFISSARGVGCDAPLASASDRVNNDHVATVMEWVKQLGPVEGKAVAILGLTYKPDTNVVEESHSIKIAQALLGQGAELQVYDPAGLGNARAVLGEGVGYASSVRDCLKDADLCLLATPWLEFKQLEPEQFIRNMRKPVILDCWGLLNLSPSSAELIYHAIGRNGFSSPKDRA